MRGFWQTREGGVDAKRAGRKAGSRQCDRKVKQIERDQAVLQRKLAPARKVIELAGKAHGILGVALRSLENEKKL